MIDRSKFAQIRDEVIADRGDLTLFALFLREGAEDRVRDSSRRRAGWLGLHRRRLGRCDRYGSAVARRCWHARSVLGAGNSREEDPEAAATALLKAGTRLVVLTLGEQGAILRGELRAAVPGVAARVLSTVGAGDVLTGTLVARLAQSDFYPPSVAAGGAGRA